MASSPLTALDHHALRAAIWQGLKSGREGGIPIGSALAIGDVIVSLGHNRRKQRGSQILHAEMDCLENAGLLTRHDFNRATIYSTLMPCHMCSGTIVQFGIRRVVIADDTFKDAEDFLKSHRVQIIVAPAPEIPLVQEICAALAKFQQEDPATWAEDIGR